MVVGSDLVLLFEVGKLVVMLLCLGIVVCVGFVSFCMIYFGS